MADALKRPSVGTLQKSNGFDNTVRSIERVERRVNFTLDLRVIKFEIRQRFQKVKLGSEQRRTWIQWLIARLFRWATWKAVWLALRSFVFGSLS